jgi:hypothetical protein
MPAAQSAATTLSLLDLTRHLLAIRSHGRILVGRYSLQRIVDGPLLVGQAITRTGALRGTTTSATIGGIPGGASLGSLCRAVQISNGVDAIHAGP